MKFFVKYGWLLLLLIIISGCGTAKLQKREQTIDRQFGGFERSRSLQRARSWLPIIQDNMVFAMRKARNLRYDFPLIAEHTTRVTAADRRLRIFSWDNLAGAEGLFWSVVAQYRTPRGKTSATLLTDGYYTGPDAFLGANITDIFVLEDCDQTFYLTLGMDITEHDKERWIFQILEVVDNKLEVCRDCFNGEKELIANLTEGEEFEYTFDPEKKTIEFLEFIIEEDGGDSSKKVKAVWKNCKFVME